MKGNRIQPEDKVEVDVYAPNGQVVTTYEGYGFHKVEDAINAACVSDKLEDAKEEYVFTVKDLTTGFESRYRINAHGHLKLIVEYGDNPE